jgi:hypothetical protein
VGADSGERSQTVLERRVARRDTVHTDRTCLERKVSNNGKKLKFSLTSK